MLGNVPKNLPKEEYQSFVASLHGDRKTMVVGTLAAIIASLATYFYDNDVNVLFFTIGFVLIGAFRFYFMTRFQKYFNKSDNAELPRKWESFAIVGGLLMAICLGSWAFYTIHFSHSQFTELVAISTCLSHMVGGGCEKFWRRYIGHFTIAGHRRADCICNAADRGYVACIPWGYVHTVFQQRQIYRCLDPGNIFPGIAIKRARSIFGQA